MARLPIKRVSALQSRIRCLAKLSLQYRELSKRFKIPYFDFERGKVRRYSPQLVVIDDERRFVERVIRGEPDDVDHVKHVYGVALCRTFGFDFITVSYLSMRKRPSRIHCFLSTGLRVKRVPVVDDQDWIELFDGFLDERVGE